MSRCIFIICLVLAGCSGSGDGADAGDGGEPDALTCEDKGPLGGRDHGMTTPVLDPCHAGWLGQHCEHCHSLPVPNHMVDRVPDCASCHGGNGACDPELSGRDHSVSEDCTGCHMNKHDYTEADDCNFCHYASQGLVDCN